MDMSARFLYLNDGGGWLTFHREGLEAAPDGTLRLAALPAPTAPLSADLASRPQPEWPAGLAVGPDGTVYWTEPATAQLFEQSACPDMGCSVGGVGGMGEAPSHFDRPRGLMFHAPSARLFVADSGNDRIPIFDPRTWQLVGVWGQGDSASELIFAAAPGVVKNPLGLAHDAAGNVYVADFGNGRVQKFDPRGDVVAAFARGQEGRRWHPTAVAVAQGPDHKEKVFALDPVAHEVRVFTTDGGEHGTVGLSWNEAPIGLAVGDGGTAYVGDGTRGRIRVYRIDEKLAGALVGEAHYHGPIAALALDGCGGLLVLTGTGRPLLLARGGGCTTAGRLWGGPFDDETLQAESWHRLRALGGLPDSGAELRLFVMRDSRDDPVPPPPYADFDADPRALDLAPAQVSAPPKPLEPGVWYRAPAQAAECLFPGSPGERLWVGVTFHSDGDASAALSQIRLYFQYEKLADRLPRFYFDEVANRGLVSRLVGLFAGLFEDVESSIGRLPARFDPQAARAEDLTYLAELLGLEAAPVTTAERLRKAIAGAIPRRAVRGTAAGLVEALWSDLGVRAVVDEPIGAVRCWVLSGSGGCSHAETTHGVGSVLGLTTALAAAEPQGAVLDSTATLDRTQLINDEELGLPLFGERAHRLLVRVHARPGAGPEFLASVRAVIERELPCHVDYQLCVIEPRMRLGLQARLGVDAVLANAPAPAPLGASALDGGMVLGGEPAARLGGASVLGRTTYLGELTPELPTHPEAHS